MNLTNNLGSLMARKHITEERLALLSSMRQGRINLIKNGKCIPKIDTALRIARAMKVRVDDIWKLNGKNPK